MLLQKKWTHKNSFFHPIIISPVKWAPVFYLGIYFLARIVPDGRILYNWKHWLVCPSVKMYYHQYNSTFFCISANIIFSFYVIPCDPFFFCYYVIPRNPFKMALSYILHMSFQNQATYESYVDSEYYKRVTQNAHKLANLTMKKPRIKQNGKGLLLDS